MIPNSVAFCNGKGGVGKTSLTANVAAIAAMSGWRVLAVDLDPQGNLGRDLGYLQKEMSDDGAALRNAIMAGAPPVPVANVRENLDVLPAGDATDDLLGLLNQRIARDPGQRLVLRDTLAAIASNYNLILMDCPPDSSGPTMTEVMLRAAHYLVIPTAFDAASLDGLARIAKRFAGARRDNPGLELLGVVLFNFNPSATRMILEVRDEVEANLNGVAPVFEGLIRSAQRAARDMRERGEVAHEYEDRAVHAEPWYLNRDDRYSSAAASVAGDYQQITEHILAEFTHKQARREAPLL